MPLCIRGVLLLAIAICQQTRPAPTTRPTGENWWESDGLVVAASVLSVEEQAWITTAGRLKKPTRDELAAYARLHTAETLKQLRAMGVNLVVLPYGGYDPEERERDARQRTIAFARACHTAGMKVGVIIPIGSVDPERWAEAEPGVADVLTLSREGRPFPAGRFGRMMTSRISRWERTRSDRLVRGAVRATDPDTIVLPDFVMAVNREPSGVADFEAYLRRRSSAVVDDGRRTDEGRETLRTEYRIAALADSLSAIRDAARDENTGVLICLKGQGLDRQVAPVAGPAVDPPSLWPLADVLWADIRLSVGARGRIRHLIAQYKAAPLVLPTPRSAIEAAQALAFNHGAVGCVAFLREGHLSGEATVRAPLRENVLEMARFSRAHRVLFAGQRCAGDVCLYRSRESGLYAGGAAGILAIQTEQALAAHHFIFDIRELGASARRDSAPDQGRVPPIIMLGGAERLSDRDIAWIEAQLRGGRGLVVIGPCGVRDELGHARTPALIDRLLAHAAGSPPESAPDRAVRFVYGGGRPARVAYLPRPGPMENVWLKIARSHRPRRAKPAYDDVLHETVRWVADRPLAVAGRFSSSVAVELTASAGAERLVLHRVNFDPHGETGPIRVTVRVPASRRAVSVERFTPDGPAPIDVAFTADGGSVTIEAAALKVYDAYLIRTEPVANATQPASSGSRGD